MIIDADCHISSHKFDGLAITADELIAQMDRAGVDKALVWLKPPYDKNIEPENHAIFEATRRYPARLLPFGWANPRLGDAATRATIQRGFEEYGFLGFKFNGAQDNYVIDSDAILPFVEFAATYKRPLAFHIGSDFFENTHPYRLGNLAARFPETRFLMIHMGGAAVPSLDLAAIETVARYPNITIIASAIPEIPILNALKQLGAERVCFGSDTPFRLMHVQLAMLRALMRDMDGAEQALVLGGNLLRMLSPMR